MKEDVKLRIFIPCTSDVNAIENEIITKDFYNLRNAENLLYELNSQYYAWKELNLDYYGFFSTDHYMAFKKLKRKYDDYGNIERSFILSNTTSELGLYKSEIIKKIRGSDIIIPLKKNMKRMPRRMGYSIKGQIESLNEIRPSDITIMLQVLSEKYPDYNSVAQDYVRGNHMITDYVFIMKNGVFQEYSYWLFDILDECKNRIDISDYSWRGRRVFTYLALHLLNIYCLKKEKDNYIIKEFQEVVFTKVLPQESLEKQYDGNAVAIALASSDYYVPYLAVLLTSLRECISNNNNYDINIFMQNITKPHQDVIKRIFASTPNVSIRFVNIERQLYRFRGVMACDSFAIETYFRLIIPEIMQEYDKILYLDSDLIVLSDPAELFEQNIDGYLIAGIHDADSAGLYNGFIPGKKNYMDNVIKVGPQEYFQAGVIVMNLNEFRRKYKTEYMLSIASKRKWDTGDQDVLNMLAKGSVRYFDMSWNVMVDWQNIRIKEIIGRAPVNLFEEYMEARKAPKIVHYAGPDKPWDIPDSDMAEIFWNYARQTDYYELILQRLEKRRSSLGNRIQLKFEEILSGLFPRYSISREIAKKLWRSSFSEIQVGKDT